MLVLLMTVALGADLRGTITDETTGSPVARAEVEASWNGGTRAVRTDAEGVYTLTGLPAGTVTLAAAKGAFDDWTEDRFVVDWGTVVVNVKLAPASGATAATR